MNKPRRYKFFTSKGKYNAFSETKDVTTMSQSDYLESLRKPCFSEQLINRSKSNTTLVTFPTSCGE